MAKTLLKRWNGKTVEEASAMKVDGVSGATFSSRGILGNMRVGCHHTQLNCNSSLRLRSVAVSSWACRPLPYPCLSKPPLSSLQQASQHRRSRFLVWLLHVVVDNLRLYVQWHEHRCLAPPYPFAHHGFYLSLGKRTITARTSVRTAAFKNLIGKNVKEYKVKINSKNIKRLNTFRKVLFAVLMLLPLDGRVVRLGRL